MPLVNTREIILIIDSVDFSSSVSNATIVPGESDADFVSFTDARSGGARMYTLVMTLKQDTDAASLWSYAWNEAGDTVTYELWTNGGGTTPSTTTPRFTGSVIVQEPDGPFIGGAADRSTNKFMTTEFEWQCTAKPTFDTGA